MVPHSAQIYRKRTLAFGDYDDSIGYGSWEATTVYYKGNMCVDNEESYRTTFLGTYKFGSDSSAVPGFTDIQYRINSKSMQIFTEDMHDYIYSLSSCDVVGDIEQFINIRHANCYPLQLVPVENCPAMYDIIRVEDDRIWVGNQFPGDGAWVAPCSDRKRPQEYDQFGLGLFVSVVGLDQTTFNLQPYIEEYISTEFQIDNRLGISTIVVEENNSNVLIPTLVLLIAAFI